MLFSVKMVDVWLFAQEQFFAVRAIHRFVIRKLMLLPARKYTLRMFFLKIYMKLMNELRNIQQRT